MMPMGAYSSVHQSQYTTQKAENDIIVYPNPAKDFIIVKTKNPLLRIKNITFYSIIGINVFDTQINLQSAEIRLNKLTPGKYLMKYTLSDNTQKIIQFIKQ